MSCAASLAAAWLGAQGAPTAGSSLPSPPAAVVAHLSVAVSLPHSEGSWQSWMLAPEIKQI